MLLHPDGLAAALSSSHQMGYLSWIQQPDGTRVYTFPPFTDATVTIDGTAQILRSLQIRIPDLAARNTADTDDVWFTPDTGTSGVLAPTGNEIVIYRLTQIRGYVDPFFGGDQVALPVGVFRFSEDDVTTDSAGLVTVTAYDRSRTVSRNRFTNPYTIAAGTLVTDALVALVQNRLPYVDIATGALVTPSTETMPLTVLDAWLDPWSEAQKMASSIGYDISFGADGRLTINPSSDDSDYNGPDWYYQEGGGQLLRVAKKISDDPGYNGVIAYSDNQTITAPIRGEAWDLNSNSPTYSLGDYGQVPMEFYSPYITSQSAADASAAALLRRKVGLTEGLSIDVIPNPALEPGDVVWVTLASERIDGAYSVDRITFPLHPTEPMSLDLRPFRPTT